MGFTVARPGGTRDAEFETYSRLLRQSGKSLGKLARVPDPGNPRHGWACVWDTQEDAERFAKKLIRRTGEKGWRVEAVEGGASTGPFGPVVIQLLSQSDGLMLVPHRLSLALVSEASPDARRSADKTFVGAQTYADFLARHGTFRDLVETLTPALTGLSVAELADLGCAVIDAESGKTRLYLPPAGLTAGHVARAETAA